MRVENKVEIWGGIEGTINRVNDNYLDQSEYSGHYEREDDIDKIASLGIKKLRYPVLWEKHQPAEDTMINWTFTERNLLRLKELNVEPIAGLVHHGSGPTYVNFFDGSFEEGLARYARRVAEKFPWLEYYTPVNEPLTTARFCGLYGHWYPHKKDDLCFYRILMSECKATVMAMKAIREINPDAKLVQTEDLGKTYSMPFLRYQAEFENHRRWLSYDLLCGRVNKKHPLWKYLVKRVKVNPEDLNYFSENPCPPDICGFNYYITSERFLDEDMSKYPEQFHGGNGKHQYADIESIRVPGIPEYGPYVLLKEAYERLRLPIAVTECHLYSTRDEQMRWFHNMWKVVNRLCNEGVDIRSITAWAVLGLHGWNKLVTEPWGTYEAGVFNVTNGDPRPTAIADLIKALSEHQTYNHPVLETEGWWERPTRLLYRDNNVISMKRRKPVAKCQPVLITGKSDSLAQIISAICTRRNIHHVLLNTREGEMFDSATYEQTVEELRPWAIINSDSFVDSQLSDQRETNSGFSNNESLLLAELCEQRQVKLLNFSTDLLQGDKDDRPFSNSDHATENVGEDNPLGEHCLLKNPNALVIQLGSFFSPWDQTNLVTKTQTNLKRRRSVTAGKDGYTPPAYIAALVDEILDLLLDNESGIFHVTNDGQLIRPEFARSIEQMPDYGIA